MPKKYPLNSSHYEVLKAIKELQPCSAPDVARKLNLKVRSIERKVHGILYSRGLADYQLIKSRGRTRRKPWTLHLTEEGEKLLNDNLHRIL